jgi:HK97 family phage portal protein
MNPIHRAVLRLNAGLKAFGQMVFGRSSWASGWWGVRRSHYDYTANVDVRSSSIVQACLLWIAKKLPQSPILVQQMTKDGPKPVPGHPLLALLGRPNPWYSGQLLLWATVQDFLAGNAYWLVVRSATGRPVELWWVPQELVEPRWRDDGRGPFIQMDEESAFIDHYDYTPPGMNPIPVATDDVIHFRWGIDPHNPRKGLSPFGSLMRELFTDEEAALYTAALVRNGGGPSVILAPDDPEADLTPAQVEEVKAKYEQNFTGDHRGRVMALGSKTQVHRLGFSPEEMSLHVLRRLPEERVTAVLGVPAAVVGLGAGLETTKVGATMAEMREVAYEDTILPLQALIAGELQAQLLPLFGRTDGLLVAFDNSRVRELQEDQDALHARAREGLRSGLLTRAQALALVGESFDAVSDDVLYLPINVTPVAPADVLAPRIEVTELPSNVRALPSGGKAALPPTPTAGFSAHPEIKSADPSPSFDRLRRRLTTRAERDVARFLDAQADRVAGRLEGAQKARKAADPDDLLPDEESALMTAALETAYLAALNGVHEWVQNQLGISFDLDDPAVRAFLREVGANIPGITATTREAIREALAEGQAAGEGIPQLARRLRGLPAFDRQRATVVARTEMGYAANGAALNRYEASGVVVGVTVHDGDQDEPCKSANGRRLTLAEARTFPRLAHPQCVRAFGPLTDASQLEAAA